MSDAKPSRTPVLLSVILGVVTLAVYAAGGMLHNQFTTYDDPDYVTDNPMVQQGLTAESVAWAFTSTRYSNWFPLTWLSHMLDWELFGSKAGGHHAMNLLLHTTAALLLFAALRRLTGTVWRSAFVAAMFGWHPVHVESVAWAAERKDVLSAAFWMLTLVAYARYVERPGKGRYALALLAFALGLMSKPMLVTLPFVLLLLDYWPLRRLRLPQISSLSMNRQRRAGVSPALTSRMPVESAHLQPSTTPEAQSGRDVRAPGPVTWSETLILLRRLVVEKIPFFALTLGSSLMTYYAQKSQAVVAVNLLPLSNRCFTALASYVNYLGKLFWPAKLAVFYPYQDFIPAGKIIAAGLILGSITLLAWRWLRPRPWFLVGWLWYLGTLVPVIGLVQVGEQAMADRYTYIPSIGVGILIAWGATALVAKRAAWRRPMQTAAVGVLAVWLGLTWQQVGYWQTNRKLFEHTLAVTEKNYMAMHMVGAALLTQDPPQLEAAIQLFRQALAIQPNYPDSVQNLGVALAGQKKFVEAYRCFEQAIRMAPNSPDSYYAYGMALAAGGHLEPALSRLDQALRMKPAYGEALTGRITVLLDLARFDEAMTACQQALAIAKKTRQTALVGEIQRLQEFARQKKPVP